MAQVSDFDVSQLSGVLIVCGHYGVGKTAFSLSLAKDAFRAGKHVTLVDLDVVNPYFRSSDQAQSLRAAGISVITPVYAGPDCNIDMPALTGAVAPAIERASSDAGELCIIDVGGDDAGAAALGRFSRTIASAPYEMWYVVNRYRALTRDPHEACSTKSSAHRAFARRQSSRTPISWATPTRMRFPSRCRLPARWRVRRVCRLRPSAFPRLVRTRRGSGFPKRAPTWRSIK